MTLGDINDGDYFSVGSTRYRVMIVDKKSDWKGCRPWVDGDEWGEHVFLRGDTEITDHEPMEKHAKIAGKNEETHRTGGSVKKEWFE